MSNPPGLDRHLRRLRRMASPSGLRTLDRALFAGGERIATNAQIKITTGEVSGRQHVPSRPGDPPNQDTGLLANNIEVVSKEPLVVEVSSNAPYSAALELGTSRMAERPFMRPARDEEKPEVLRLVQRALGRLARDSG